MTVADRYEGQAAGTCGCGSPLVWVRGTDGEWHVQHTDLERAMECSAKIAPAVSY